jgi:prepilin signal peptidase PulO-like enzyme (type II secretory pathway)
MSIQLKPVQKANPASARPPARARAATRQALSLITFLAFAVAVSVPLGFVSWGLALALAVGLACGYFADLFFDRFYTDGELSAQMYRCSGCRSPLRAAFGVPVLGVLFHRLRCPDCGKRLPMRSVILPTGAAELFAVSYFVFDDTGPALLAGFFATVFLVLTLTDLETRLLPNRVVYPATLLAIAFCWAWPDTSAGGILLGGGVAIAIAAALLLLSLPFGKGAFGMGDVKMIVLIGFVVGFPAFTAALLIGTFAAGAVAAFLVVTRLRSTKDYIPHGPFLALGAVIALFLR